MIAVSAVLDPHAVPVRSLPLELSLRGGGGFKGSWPAMMPRYPPPSPGPARHLLADRKGRRHQLVFALQDVQLFSSGGGAGNNGGRGPVIFQQLLPPSVRHFMISHPLRGATLFFRGRESGGQTVSVFQIIGGHEPDSF